MMSDAIPSGKPAYLAFTLVLDLQQVEEGNAGLTTLPLTEKSKWPGRKLRSGTGQFGIWPCKLIPSSKGEERPHPRPTAKL